MASEPLWALTLTAETSTDVERAAVAERIENSIGPRPTWILLRTCHRVELYGLGEPPDLGPGLLHHSGSSATRRLLRVAAGLESAMVGEDEVLHQVRGTLKAATGRPLDARLQRLFESAVATGRRARSRSNAGGGNLAQSAIEWLERKTRLEGQQVVVAGAGRMGAALAHALRGAGAEVVIASRDPRRARRLAAIYGGRGVDLTTGAQLVERSAAVAVALAGPWADLATTTAPSTVPPIADISSPSAVPAAVRARLNGSFLGIDALFRAGGAPPPGYIEAAEAVVDRKAAEYDLWLETQA